MEDVRDHLERGRGYIRHRMWDDAIRELERARLIVPDDLTIALALAEAYEGRGRETDYPADLRLAGTLAREVVDADPTNNEAFALLARLEGKREAGRDTGPAPGENRPQYLSGPMVFVLALVFIALGVIVALETSEAPRDGSPQSAVKETRSVIPPPPEQPPVAIPSPSDHEIAVTVVENEQTTGLEFKPRKSRLDVYPEQSFYRLWGSFEVTGDVEVETIDIQLELLADSVPVVADSWQAWASHEATLRPGDHAVFEHLVRAKPEVDEARLTVTRVVTTSAHPSYAVASPVELRWTVARPEGVELEVLERSARYKPSELLGGGFFEAEWEFINRGSAPLRNVKYEVRLLDNRGKIAEQMQRLATFPSATPIEPGEVRLESVVRQVPAYERYELSIVQIE